jgi:hypothetical protein
MANGVGDVEFPERRIPLAITRLIMENTASWILSPSNEALQAGPAESSAISKLILLLMSSLLSVSLAETLAISGGRADWGRAFFTFGAAFWVWTFLFYKLSKIFSKSVAPFSKWFIAGVHATLPLHLALPAALVFHGPKPASMLVYELAKALIFFAIAKRSVHALETLNGWPSWAATLLFISPFLIAVFGFILMGVLFFGAVLLLFAGFH